MSREYPFVKSHLKKKRHKLQYPKKLTEIEPDEALVAFPSSDEQKPERVWISRKYLVQLFDASNNQYPDLKRLSVNRTKRNQHGWLDGITWDELMQIKTAVGFGDTYAIEVYPRDRDVVNVANIRHLWLLKQPLLIGWFGIQYKDYLK